MRKPVYLRQLEKWLIHLERKGYAKSTIQRGYYFPVLRAYRELRNAGFQTAPSRITKESAEYIIREIFKRNATMVSAWNNYLKYSGNAIVELIEYRPAPIKRTNVDWLNIEEGEDFTVWEAWDTPQEAILIHCELHLGMRRTSLERFKIPYYKGRYLDILGKGRGEGKWRTISAHPLTSQIFNIISDYREDLEKRFGTLPDNITTYNYHSKLKIPSANTLDKWLSNIRDRTGLKFSHHTLRRTCGRKIYLAQLSEGKQDLASIRDFLGHSSVDTTIQYLGINLLDQEKMMDIAHSYDLKRKNALNCTELEILAP